MQTEVGDILWSLVPCTVLDKISANKTNPITFHSFWPGSILRSIGSETPYFILTWAKWSDVLFLVTAGGNNILFIFFLNFWKPGCHCNLVRCVKKRKCTWISEFWSSKRTALFFPVFNTNRLNDINHQLIVWNCLLLLSRKRESFDKWWQKGCAARGRKRGTDSLLRQHQSNNKRRWWF